MWWVTVLLTLGACDNGTPAIPPTDRAVPSADQVIWHQVGSWSGRGNTQTETFTSDTGGFRVRWETSNETVPGRGTFKLVFRSNDSGRPIIDAIDVRGVGRDTVEVADIVRWYYITIESANVDWRVSVDERIRGRGGL
jgi:hypothetical protein